MATTRPEPGNGGIISGRLISPPAPVEITTGFTYLADPHEYRLDGVRLPSVTEIVNSVSAGQSWATEWHLDRGSKVHRAIALMLAGRLDFAALDPRIRGRVEAAKKAIADLGLTADGAEIEVPRFHPTLRFAGTPDYFRAGVLADWKSSHRAESEPQAGGYCLLLEAAGLKVKTIYEVVLADGGKYKLNTYKPGRCRALFTAAYTIWSWQNDAH